MKIYLPIVIILSSLVFYENLKAQSNQRYSIGLNLISGVNSTDNNYSKFTYSGIGPTIGYEYFFNSEKSLIGHLSYLTIVIKDGDGFITPLNLGYKKYTNSNSEKGFYFLGLLEFNYLNASLSTIKNSTNIEENLKKSSFYYGLGVGGGYMFNEHFEYGVSIDLLFGQEMILSYGARIAYNFSKID